MTRILVRTKRPGSNALRLHIPPFFWQWLVQGRQMGKTECRLMHRCYPSFPSWRAQGKPRLAVLPTVDDELAEPGMRALCSLSHVLGFQRVGTAIIIYDANTGFASSFDDSNILGARTWP